MLGDFCKNIPLLLSGGSISFGSPCTWFVDIYSHFLGIIAMAGSWKSPLSSGDVPALPTVNMELANRNMPEKYYKIKWKGSAIGFIWKT